MLQRTGSFPTGEHPFGFGDSVDISGDTLIVGSNLGILSSATRYDRATVYTRTAGVWSLQATLETGVVPPGGSPLGYASVAVGIDGNTAMVGTGQEAVHVFVRSGATWAEQARLVNPDAATNAPYVRFAGVKARVALDGDTIAVGAPTNNLAVNPALGAVYIFTRVGTTWSLQAKLTRGDLRWFGSYVSLSGDSLLVGNYLYQRSGTSWVEAPGPSAPPPASVPFSELYRAKIHGDVAAIAGTTSVLPFRRVGSSWFAQERLTPSDPQTFGPYEAIGDIAISGLTIVAGAPWAEVVISSTIDYAPGAAYVFDLDPVALPPGPPTNLTASVTGNTVNLSWAAPLSGGAPTRYELIGRLSAGGPVVGTLPVGALTSFALPVPNGTFVLSVAAANGSGTGPESTPVTVTVPQAAPPPGAPSNLSVNVAGSTVSFGWSPPASGGTVENYVLVAGVAPAFNVPVATVPLPPTPTFAAPGVPAGVFYARVLAQNSGGASAPSNEVSFTVAGASAPGMPTLNVPSVNGSTVTLSWSPGGGGAPTTYTLVVRLTPGGSPIATAPLAGTSVSFAGVPSGVYHLTLIAANGAGASPPSASVSLTVP